MLALGFPSCIISALRVSNGTTHPIEWAWAAAVAAGEDRKKRTRGLPFAVILGLHLVPGIAGAASRPDWALRYRSGPFRASHPTFGFTTSLISPSPSRRPLHLCSAPFGDHKRHCVLLERVRSFPSKVHFNPATATFLSLSFSLPSGEQRFVSTELCTTNHKRPGCLRALIKARSFLVNERLDAASTSIPSLSLSPAAEFHSLVDLPLTDNKHNISLKHICPTFAASTEHSTPLLRVCSKSQSSLPRDRARRHTLSRLSPTHQISAKPERSK